MDLNLTLEECRISGIMESSVLNQTRVLLDSFIVSGRASKANHTLDNVTMNERHTFLLDKEFTRRSVLEVDTTVIQERRNTLNESLNMQRQDISEVAINKILADALNESNDYVIAIQNIIDVLENQFSGIKNFDKNNLQRIFCDAELQTWKLLQILGDDSCQHDYLTEDLKSVMNHVYSEKSIVEEMFRADQFVRKVAKLVDWLEVSYEPMSNVPPTKFCYFENTINEQASVVNSTISVHPDCQFQNQKYFNSADGDNVAVFMRFAFELIRQGKIDTLTKVAVQYGFAWLPAALEGRKLSHDPNFQEETSNGEKSKSGNVHRKLWKRVCAANAANKSIPMYERAIYAVFAGDLDVLLSVAKTSNDKLWSHCKCFIQAMQDYQIALYKNEDHPSPKPSLELAKIFDLMKDTFTDNEDIANKIQGFFQEAQKVIIQGKFDVDHIFGVKEWLSKDENLSLRMDRFCALFSIIISQMKKIRKYDYAICKFCKSLHHLEQADLIPDFLKYAENPVSTCLQIVVGLEPVKRDSFLDCCQMKGIEISTVKQELFAHYKLDYSSPESGSDPYSSTPDEDLMIGSLENLRSEVANETEFLCHYNSLMRLFLRNKRYFPCFKLLEIVPRNVIDSIVQQQCNFSSMEYRLEAAVDLPAKESCIIKEFICLRDVVSLLIDMQGAGKALSDFDETEDEQVHACFSGVLGILNFDGGWLVDEFDHSLLSGNFFTEERTHQMKLLRERVIPEIVLLSVSFLKQKGQTILCTDILQSLFDSSLVNDLTDQSLNSISEFCLNAVLTESTSAEDSELYDLFSV